MHSPSDIKPDLLLIRACICVSKEEGDGSPHTLLFVAVCALVGLAQVHDGEHQVQEGRQVQVLVEKEVVLVG